MKIFSPLAIVFVGAGVISVLVGVLAAKSSSDKASRRKDVAAEQVVVTASLPPSRAGNSGPATRSETPPASKTEPSKTEPSKTEPSKTEPSKTEPSKTEPSKTGPAPGSPAERTAAAAVAAGTAITTSGAPAGESSGAAEDKGGKGPKWARGKGGKPGEAHPAEGKAPMALAHASPSPAASTPPPKAGFGSHLAERRVFELEEAAKPRNKVDELVYEKLKQLQLTPAYACNDSVFVRRIYLDMIGTLPTLDEALKFLEDKSPTKRQDLIDALFKREDFCVYWAMRWSDLLRIKAEFPINMWPNAAQAYHRWVKAALRENMPYDQMVRELLTSSGSNFRVGQVNFYRAMQGRKPETTAQITALTLMGTRTESWPPERLAGMANFFAQTNYKGTQEWKEEIISFEPGKVLLQEGGAEKLKAIFPNGTPVQLSAEKDPREVFADWLIDGKNPNFAPVMVNRIWCWLFGRGIVHEPDDFRADNPPQNPELLQYLTQELVNAKWDLRHVYRLILNSATYQSSFIASCDSAKSAENFGHYSLRRLEGEVLIDAICQITGSQESYSSPIPEPYSWIPDFERTIALPDGSITSSFLEMFGRPPRDTGRFSERTNKLTAAQRLHLLNSTHIRHKFERGKKFQDFVKGASGADDLTQRLYLTILSRRPTDEEKNIVRGKQASDISWALVNSVEFLHRH